jgi:hypothetical protein
MSIDARVDDVTVHASGAGELRLKDRPGRPGRGPQDGGIAGQTVLFFDRCPPDVWKLGGKDIWGGSDTIMLGDVKIAEREGYTKIKFVVPFIAGALGETAPPPPEGRGIAPSGPRSRPDGVDEGLANPGQPG